MFDESFPDSAFFGMLVLSGDQLVPTKSTFVPKISPQWLSELIVDERSLINCA